MHLTKKQKEAAKILLSDKVVELVGYGGAAGGGKSYLGCFWIMMSGEAYPGTKYFIGRDSLKDTKGSVLMTWRKLANEIDYHNWTISTDSIIFDNGSHVEFLDLSFYPQKDPMYERFGSKEYTSGWIEEAGQVHYMAFEILKTRVGRWMNSEYNIKKKILSTFNPKKNWVDTTFYRPYKKGEESKDTRFIYALATDNPHLPEDYIDSLRNLKDKATRERLLFGNFDYDDDPTSLISYEDISSLYTNDYVKEGEMYIVSDIARFGSDKAVISVWSGLVLMELITFDTSSTIKIQETINAMRTKYRVQLNKILVDEDGVGGGVVDSLRCRGFLNGGKPKNKQYYNNKAECGYKLSEEIKNIHVKAPLTQIQKESIEEELAQLKTYEADKDGKLRILPKEKIKDAIGRSPDYLDVFIMRMWFEVNQGSYKLI